MVQIRVENTGDRTIYLRCLDLALYAPDGTLLYEAECNGRRPEFLLPGENGCFKEFISRDYNFPEGYKELEPSEITAGVDNVKIFAYDEEILHWLEVSDLQYSVEERTLSATVTNDLDEPVFGYLHDEAWGDPYYTYKTCACYYDRDGLLLDAQVCWDTYDIEAHSSESFVSDIYLSVPAGTSYSEIDHVVVIAYITEYEPTVKMD